MNKMKMSSDDNVVVVENIVHVPEPKIFFRKNHHEKLSILEPLYLYTLIEYLEILDDYYLQEKHLNDVNEDCNHHRMIVDGKNQHQQQQQSSFDDQTFDEKIQNVFRNLNDDDDNHSNNNNDHGYRKHLIEDVYFNIEQVDRLIEMLDERLERIQLMAIFNDQNNHHQREQQQQQQQSMMNVDHQQRPYIKQLLFTTEVIDLTCQQQNDDEQQQQQIAQQQPLNQELSSFIQLDGIVLPLPDEFCRMKVEKQQYLLQPLPQSVRQKYLEICSKNLSHDFLQLFSNLLKQF